MAAGTLSHRPTNAAAHNWLDNHQNLTRFSPEEWEQLLDDDRVALSRISLLLTAIISAGMVGMLVVVAILRFG